MTYHLRGRLLMDYTTISSYLTYCKTHKRLSKHTVRAYKNDLEQFYRSGENDVIEYINNLAKANIKTSTLKRKIACLKTFYKYLEFEDLIAQNPFYQMRFQFRSEKGLPKVIPVNELKLIYFHLQERLSASNTKYQKEKAQRNLLIVSLLLSTGVRISELCNLTIDHIDLPNRIIHILGKGQKERSIYLGDDTTYKLLKKYITTYHSPNNFFLFTGKKNNSCLAEQSVRLMLKTVQKRIKLDRNITPHMFRHSFATMLLENNVDIRYIQQILGHSSIAVTQIYTHVSQNKQQEILSFSNPITTIKCFTSGSEV